jgi:hypothetical protein
MEKFRISTAMRLFLLFVSVVIWCGILLTGIRNVHWFLFIVPVIFPLAALFNFCPGMALTRMITKEKSQQ